MSRRATDCQEDNDKVDDGTTKMEIDDENEDVNNKNKNNNMKEEEDKDTSSYTQDKQVKAAATKTTTTTTTTKQQQSSSSSLSSSQRRGGGGYQMPFVEKYRPKTLDHVVGNEETIHRLRAIAKTGNVPNLILSGT